MNSYKKILCAHDMSDCSSGALEQAADLAERFGAELIVLHAIEPLLLPAAYGLSPDPLVDYEHLARESAAAHLKPLIERFAARGLRVSLRVPWGSPAEEVCAAVAREGVDLVVVGTHGHRGLKHALLGSTAERILRTCPCPVLAVKRPARAAA
jgi:nucleotide-binding universal stress UspA family protein